MAKLVDAPDLGSGVLRRAGSSPVGRTQKVLTADDDAVRTFSISSFGYPISKVKVFSNHPK